MPEIFIGLKGNNGWPTDEDARVPNAFIDVVH